MNRRAFLGAIGLAPVVAVVSVAKPAYASGGSLMLGEGGPEAIMPLKRKQLATLDIKIDTAEMQAKLEEFRAISENAVRDAIDRRVAAGMTRRDASRDLAAKIARRVV